MKRHGCAVLVGLVMAAALATGPTEAATRDRDDAAFIADVNRVVAEAPLVRLRERTETRRLSTCNRRSTPDPRGDGQVDIVSSRVVWSCEGSTALDPSSRSGPTFVIGFDRRVAELDKVLVAIEVDMDRDARTGCGGTDRLFAMSLFTDAFGREAHYDIPSCDRSTWRRLADGAVNSNFLGRNLRVSTRVGRVTPKTAYRWFAGTYPEGKTAGSDRTPDRGWSLGGLLPGAVRQLTLEPRETSVVARWQPADGRGLRVTNYRVSVYRYQGRRVAEYVVPGSSRSFLVSGLKVAIGLSYTIIVTAKNDQGWSNDITRGSTARYSPYTRPLPPIDLVLSERLGVDGAYDITWNHPTNNSGRILQSVILTVTPNGGQPVVAEYPVSPRRIELPDLVPGTTYTIALQAKHSAATGDPTSIEFTVPV